MADLVAMVWGNRSSFLPAFSSVLNITGDLGNVSPEQVILVPFCEKLQQSHKHRSAITVSGIMRCCVLSTATTSFGVVLYGVQFYY